MLGICSAAIGLPSTVATAVAACPAAHWVSSWYAAPSDNVSVADEFGTLTFAAGDQTYRMVVTPHRGGAQTRVRLSNRYRSVPLTIERATVASQADGAAVQPGSLRSLTFSGAAGVTVAPGTDIVSDPVDLTVTAWQPVAIGFHTAGAAALLTQHQVGNATSYYTLPGSGDHTADVGGAAFSQRTTAVLVASGLDVLAPGDVSAVVALGDSITDGFETAGLPGSFDLVGTDSRYPDFLQRRLDAVGLPVSVVDAGISGNRVLIPSTGVSALDRLDSDVIDRAGVTDVIVVEGINDVKEFPYASADQVVAGYETLIARLRAAGLRVHLGTLSGGILPFAEPARQQVDTWIRSQQLSDSVVDFDAALRDPVNPRALAAPYASADGLHPSPAGYQRMADAVDVATLTTNHC
ncbi:GDSL family lipase [Nocardia stercoris]|uniref:GDSL family lipase n=1 Tax=Nocardia stercoris TaxID=2483361 RepID=A0A3M2KY75_9NOCA|nr:GDSL family lipase [Nocardia stercoris]